MIDASFNDIDIEESMKSIKSYLLDESHNPEIFQAHMVNQKNYLINFNPNSNQISQFIEQMREILEILKKNAINQMLIILNEYILFVKEETKSEPNFSSILGENWEKQLTYFDQIQKIKENIINQVQAIGKVNEFKSKMSQIFIKLDGSIKLFHIGYIANIFLLMHNQSSNLHSGSQLNSQSISNMGDNDSSIDDYYGSILNDEFESGENAQPRFDFNEIYNLIQSNKETRLTTKFPLLNFYNPFDDTNNEIKSKSVSRKEPIKKDEKERKLIAYRNLYIKKRQEKLNELVKKKKEEAKQEFILNYKKQLLEEKMKEQQEEISKLKHKLESLEQQSNEALNDLVQQIESSKLVDLSKVSLNDPESIQKVLQEKIDILKSIDQKGFEDEITQAENELNDTKDELFVKSVRLLQVTNQLNIQKEKAAQNQLKKKNPTNPFEKQQKESLECAFSIYVFFLNYREKILKLPNPKNLIYPSNSQLPYPENYRNEFEKIINQNGLEWLIRELRSLL